MLLALLARTASADVCDAYGGCWPTVHDALAATTSDLELTVAEGQYVEPPMAIPDGRSVTLTGGGPAILTGAVAGAPLFDVRGRLTVVDLTLAGLRAPVIASTNGHVTVEGSVLLTVDLVPDGGIVAVRGGSLDVDGSTLLDGLSVGRGGQIFASDARVTITGSTLLGGFARSGGAIALEATAPMDVTVRDCRFEDSTAIDDGGAIAVTGPVALRVTGSTFTGHRARIGGAIASDVDPDASIEVVGSVFEGDEASDGGGALHLRGGTALLDGNLLVGNRGGVGGAIALSGLSSATVARNLACDNQATDGGALWLDLAGGRAVVTNDRWLRNRASGAGGGVHVQSGVVDLAHQHLVANEASAGAALSLAGASDVTLTWTLVSWNLGAAPLRGIAAVERRNLFFGNDGLLTGLDPSDLLLDPELLAWDESAACAALDDTYSFYGPLRDPYEVGTGDLLDLDGSPPDIGAYGGPEAPPELWDDPDDDGSPRLLDCDDDHPGVYPSEDGANEVWYDGVDQDCDGRDTDEDGDGIALPLDCDDRDPTVYPGAVEIAGGGDMDCDGRADADGDGYQASEDCDDDDPRVHPGAAEDPDPAVDQDCDGVGDPLGPLVRASCATVDGAGLSAVALALALSAGRRRRAPASRGGP